MKVYLKTVSANVPMVTKQPSFALRSMLMSHMPRGFALISQRAFSYGCPPKIAWLLYTENCIKHHVVGRESGVFHKQIKRCVWLETHVRKWMYQWLFHISTFIPPPVISYFEEILNKSFIYTELYSYLWMYYLKFCIFL